MNIYHITRNDILCHDEYISLMIIEESEAKAMQIALEPDKFVGINDKNIQCDYIGKANIKQRAGVIMDSYNAG